MVPRIHQSARRQVWQFAVRSLIKANSTGLLVAAQSVECYVPISIHRQLHLRWPSVCRDRSWFFTVLWSDPIFCIQSEFIRFLLSFIWAPPSRNVFLRCCVVQGYRPFLSGVGDSTPNLSKRLRMSKVRPSLILYWYKLVCIHILFYFVSVPATFQHRSDISGSVVAPISFRLAPTS